jgi:hypothetical protein
LVAVRVFASTQAENQERTVWFGNETNVEAIVSLASELFAANFAESVTYEMDIPFPTVDMVQALVTAIRSVSGITAVPTAELSGSTVSYSFPCGGDTDVDCDDLRAALEDMDLAQLETTFASSVTLTHTSTFWAPVSVNLYAAIAPSISSTVADLVSVDESQVRSRYSILDGNVVNMTVSVLSTSAAEADTITSALASSNLVAQLLQSKAPLRVVSTFPFSGLSCSYFDSLLSGNVAATVASYLTAETAEDNPIASLVVSVFASYDTDSGCNAVITIDCTTADLLADVVAALATPTALREQLAITSLLPFGAPVYGFPLTVVFSGVDVLDVQAEINSISSSVASVLASDVDAWLLDVISVSDTDVEMVTEARLRFFVSSADEAGLVIDRAQAPSVVTELAASVRVLSTTTVGVEIVFTAVSADYVKSHWVRGLTAQLKAFAKAFESPVLVSTTEMAGETVAKFEFRNLANPAVTAQQLNARIASGTPLVEPSESAYVSLELAVIVPNLEWAGLFSSSFIPVVKQQVVAIGGVRASDVSVTVVQDVSDMQKYNITCQIDAHWSDTARIESALMGTNDFANALVSNIEALEWGWATFSVEVAGISSTDAALTIVAPLGSSLATLWDLSDAAIRVLAVENVTDVPVTALLNVSYITTNIAFATFVGDSSSIDNVRAAVAAEMGGLLHNVTMRDETSFFAFGPSVQNQTSTVDGPWQLSGCVNVSVPITPATFYELLSHTFASIVAGEVSVLPQDVAVAMVSPIEDAEPILRVDFSVQTSSTADAEAVAAVLATDLSASISTGLSAALTQKYFLVRGLVSLQNVPQRFFSEEVQTTLSQAVTGYLGNDDHVINVVATSGLRRMSLEILLSGRTYKEAAAAKTLLTHRDAAESLTGEAIKQVQRMERLASGKASTASNFRAESIVRATVQEVTPSVLSSALTTTGDSGASEMVTFDMSLPGPVTGAHFEDFVENIVSGLLVDALGVSERALALSTTELQPSGLTVLARVYAPRTADSQRIEAVLGNDATASALNEAVLGALADGTEVTVDMLVTNVAPSLFEASLKTDFETQLSTKLGLDLSQIVSVTVSSASSGPLGVIATVTLACDSPTQATSVAAALGHTNFTLSSEMAATVSALAASMVTGSLTIDEFPLRYLADIRDQVVATLAERAGASVNDVQLFLETQEATGPAYVPHLSIEFGINMASAAVTGSIANVANAATVTLLDSRVATELATSDLPRNQTILRVRFVGMTVADVTSAFKGSLEQDIADVSSSLAKDVEVVDQRNVTINCALRNNRTEGGVVTDERKLFAWIIHCDGTRNWIRHASPACIAGATVIHSDDLIAYPRRHFNELSQSESVAACLNLPYAGADANSGDGLEVDLRVLGLSSSVIAQLERKEFGFYVYHSNAFVHSLEVTSTVQHGTSDATVSDVEGGDLVMAFTTVDLPDVSNAMLADAVTVSTPAVSTLPSRMTVQVGITSDAPLFLWNGDHGLPGDDIQVALASYLFLPVSQVSISNVAASLVDVELMVPTSLETSVATAVSQAELGTLLQTVVSNALDELSPTAAHLTLNVSGLPFSTFTTAARMELAGLVPTGLGVDIEASVLHDAVDLGAGSVSVSLLVIGDNATTIVSLASAPGLSDYLTSAVSGVEGDRLPTHRTRVTVEWSGVDVALFNAAVQSSFQSSVVTALGVEADLVSGVTIDGNTTQVTSSLFVHGKSDITAMLSSSSSLQMQVAAEVIDSIAAEFPAQSLIGVTFAMSFDSSMVSVDVSVTSTSAASLSAVVAQPSVASTTDARRLCDLTITMPLVSPTDFTEMYRQTLSDSIDATAGSAVPSTISASVTGALTTRVLTVAVSAEAADSTQFSTVCPALQDATFLSSTNTLYSTLIASPRQVVEITVDVTNSLNQSSTEHVRTAVSTVLDIELRSVLAYDDGISIQVVVFAPGSEVDVVRTSQRASFAMMLQAAIDPTVTIDNITSSSVPTDLAAVASDFTFKTTNVSEHVFVAQNVAVVVGDVVSVIEVRTGTDAKQSSDPEVPSVADPEVDDPTINATVDASAPVTEDVQLETDTQNVEVESPPSVVVGSAQSSSENVDLSNVPSESISSPPQFKLASNSASVAVAEDKVVVSLSFDGLEQDPLLDLSVTVDNVQETELASVAAPGEIFIVNVQLETNTSFADWTTDDTTAVENGVANVVGLSPIYVHATPENNAGATSVAVEIIVPSNDFTEAATIRDTITQAASSGTLQSGLVAAGLTATVTSVGTPVIDGIVPSTSVTASGSPTVSPSISPSTTSSQSVSPSNTPSPSFSPSVTPSTTPSLSVVDVHASPTPSNTPSPTPFAKAYTALRLPGISSDNSNPLESQRAGKEALLEALQTSFPNITADDVEVVGYADVGSSNVTTKSNEAANCTVSTRSAVLSFIVHAGSGTAADVKAFLELLEFSSAFVNDFNTFLNCSDVCCGQATNVTFEISPKLIDAAITPPPPRALVSGASITLDQDERPRMLTADVFFVRSPDEGTEDVDQLFGYRLYLINTANKGLEGNSSARIVSQKGLADLGGGPGQPVQSPLKLQNVNVTGFTDIAVVAFNLFGESDKYVTLPIEDGSPPTAVAREVAISRDVDPTADRINVEVTFVRINETSTGPARVEGYRLFIGQDGERIREVQSRTLDQLGGVPGERVAHGFHVVGLDIDVDELDNLYVDAYNREFTTYSNDTLAGVTVDDAEGLGWMIETIIMGVSAGLCAALFLASGTTTVILGRSGGTIVRSISVGMASSLPFVFHLQDMALIGKVRSSWLPMPLRSAGRAVRWSTGYLGVWRALFGSRHLDLEHHERDFAIITDSVALETFVWDTVATYGSLLLVLLLALAWQNFRNRNVRLLSAKRLWWVRQNMRMISGAVMSASVGLGLACSSILQASDAEGLFPVLASLAVPAMALVLSGSWQAQWAPTFVHTYRPFLGSRSHQWYVTVALIRRFATTALVSLVVVDAEYQAMGVAMTFMLHLVLLLAARPFDGYASNPLFYFDLLSVVANCASSIMLLVCHHEQVESDIVASVILMVHALLFAVVAVFVLVVSVRQLLYNPLDAPTGFDAKTAKSPSHSTKMMIDWAEAHKSWQTEIQLMPSTIHAASSAKHGLLARTSTQMQSNQSLQHFEMAAMGSAGSMEDAATPTMGEPKKKGKHPFSRGGMRRSNSQAQAIMADDEARLPGVDEMDVPVTIDTTDELMSAISNQSERMDRLPGGDDTASPSATSGHP